MMDLLFLLEGGSRFFQATILSPRKVCFEKEIRRAQGKGRDDVNVTGTRELLLRGREFVH